MDDLQGGCLCKQVRYRINAQAQPMRSYICWCKDCQYQSANGLVAAIFADEAITVSGKLQDFHKVSDSGNTITRQFCADCGTHIFGINSGRNGFKAIRLGTLDDTNLLAPTMNIWTTSAAQWACLNQQMNNIAQQP